MSEERILPEFIREDDLPLFLSVQEYTRDKIKEWIDIKIDLEDNNAHAAGMKKLAEALYSSASLERLFLGLPVKATRINSFGGPWFELIEQGEDICADVWKVSVIGFTHGGKVKINGENWKVVDKTNDDDMIVYQDGDPDETKFRLTRASKEDIDRLLHPRLRRLSDGKEKYSWKLQAIAEEKDE